MVLNTKEIVERVNMTLKNAGIKQKDLIHQLGLTNSTFGDWKRSKRINAETALKVACFLKVPLYWLLTGENEDDTESLLTDDEAEVVRIYRDLPTEHAKRRAMRQLSETRASEEAALEYYAQILRSGKLLSSTAPSPPLQY